MKNYSHLSAEERAFIQLGLNRGLSIRSISRDLERSASTISREITRQPVKRYCAKGAGARYHRVRQHCGRSLKLQPGHCLTLKVRQGLLNKQW